MIDEKSLQSDKTQGASFKIGSISSLNANGTAAVTFDGDSTESTKQYAYLQSYKSPAVNDRVLLAAVGGTYVILGKIGYNTAPDTAIYLQNDDDARFDELEIDGALNHDGSTIGFFGTTPRAKYSIATISTSSTLATTISKLNELINDLKGYGLFA